MRRQKFRLPKFILFGSITIKKAWAKLSLTQDDLIMFERSCISYIQFVIGRLAQLVSATVLHTVGRGFESLSAHTLII